MNAAAFSYRIKKTAAWLTVGCLVMGLSWRPVGAQMSIPNPLIKPVKAGRALGDPNMPPLPGDGAAVLKMPPPDAAGKAGDGPGGGESPKNSQENFTLQQQVLNSERIPAPLRNLLSSMAVTAIVGNIAVLRQQAVLSQQGAANGNQGLTASPGGVASPGTSGALNGGGGVSGTPGLSTSLAPALPKTFSVRIRHQQTTYIAGLPVRAQVDDGVVTLFWKPQQGEELMVFYGNVETGSQAGYVPPAGLLERRDASAYQSVTPAATNGPSGGGAGQSAGQSPGQGGAGGVGASGAVR
ncbi:MAG: hypothetical protein ACK5NY_06540 [Burkholderiaceae bacterium]|jgi:hypothetical protein